MNRKKIKVLNIKASLNCGGGETWLMHVVENIDRSKFQIDFLVRVPEKSYYENRLEALGSNIYRVTGKINGKKKYLHHLFDVWNIIKKNGPYDIMHCHGLSSGIYAWIGKRLGVPVRIAHSHNDHHRKISKRKLGKISGFLQRKFIKVYATHGLAASESAAYSMFGRNWEKNPRFKILFCGIELDPFKNKVDKRMLREKMNISYDLFVVGHVGRFDEQKNHKKIINVFAEFLKIKPNSLLLLVGDGTLKGNVEEQVAQLGLEKNVVFTGVRDDVANLMLGVMDMFLFPSLFEGLGLVLVEAQAAGLPCVISDVIPSEADIVSDLVNRISLTVSDEKWAREMIQKGSLKRPNIDLTKFRDFDVKYSVRLLSEFYQKTINDKERIT